jgi:hypothetical protein
MDDSSLFLQWAVNMLEHHDRPGVLADNGGEFPSIQALRGAATVVVEPTELAEATQSCRSSGGGGEIGCVSWSMSPNSGGTSVPRGTVPMSWNFGAVSARPSGGGGGTLDTVAAPIPELVYRSQPTRCTAGTGSASPAYAQGHIMAERKRREKINQRFIELSAVIPGLKKVN